jgi:type VI secretion system protein
MHPTEASPGNWKKRGRAAQAALLASVAAIALAGCGGVGPKRLVASGQEAVALERLTVSADAGANRGNATGVDVVVAYTDRALAALPAAGPDWFRQRAALLAGFPDEISVVSLEVPGPSAGF